MFESIGNMGYFYKERNKLVGESNDLTWKKRIELEHIELKCNTPNFSFNTFSIIWNINFV